MMDDLEKPWTIKQKPLAPAGAAPQQQADPSDFVPEESPHLRWKFATVAWLCKTELFAPTLLPKMQVPTSKSQGVYDSSEQYLDTVERLMIGMTFSDGNGVLSPRCYHDKCGSTLWPVPQGQGLRCRTHHCNGTVVLACSNRYHDGGLCKRCAENTQAQLMGPAGPRASTHIYDGKVSHVDADGKLYVREFQCRCPPQHQIHWRSTRRLACPNLVGVVRLAANGASLRPDDRIHWGEITLHGMHHGKPQDESLQRQHGHLAINMTSILADFDPDSFAEGDNLALIDCMTFVPEFLPVLRALEQQRLSGLPFEDGALLNLCSYRPADLRNTVGDSPDLYNIKMLVQEMIAESKLQPIIEIRRDPVLSSQLNQRLVSLVTQTTLDEGQLVSFIDALRNPMHLTQGPPGTGKSYLGVVLVRALMIVRALWMQINHSVGTPPILVLSYKNHAIDEFLVDIAQAERSALHGKMIRIGGGGKNSDPRLQQFSERTFHRADPETNHCRHEVDRLHHLAHVCKHLGNSTAMFASYQLDIFMPEKNGADAAAQHKKSTTAAYEATEVLLASLIRSKLLTDAIDRAGAYAADSDDSDYTGYHNGSAILAKVDFLTQDDVDPRGRNLQRMLDSRAVFSQIGKLHEGIAHYIEMDYRFDDPGEVLHMFLKGGQPYPMCSFEEGCPNLAAWHEVALCDAHRCSHTDSDSDRQCPQPVSPGKRLCREHVCEEPSCHWPRLPPPQSFCGRHACCKCVQLGRKAGLASEDPPRNVCSEHPLCCNGNCLELARPREDYCEKHAAWWRNFMKHRRFFEDDAPNEDFASIEGSEDGDDRGPLPEKKTMFCKGKNRRGKSCGALAVNGSEFCRVHAPPESSFATHLLQAQEEPPAGAKPANRWQKNKQAEKAEEQRGGAAAAPRGSEGEASSSRGPPGPDAVAQAAAPAQEVPAAEGEDAAAVGRTPADAEMFFDPPEFVDKADAGRYDNPDEVEEGDNLQHLREVFELGDAEDSEGSESSSSADGEEAAADASGAAAAGAEANGASAQPASAHLRNPSEWTWDMKLEERWEACQAFMFAQREQLQEVSKKVREQMPVARRALHDAKVRSNARIYENKSVIGGTIVGCIARLEAIRSTNPFAIVVEEASEVLEPLLCSCLCPSTVKLEMIGDHLQLQPSIMQKFEFERINHVNVSMFERLIRAPEGHKVPSAVLALQRRMRRDVCDLTREYYKEIVAIQDHEVTGTRTMPGAKAKASSYKGREVPGVRSHIYLWTHSGDQQKADVGLSKINRHEAEMAVWLAYYLVACGVEKPSIAILTPYKGQLMLMRQQLLKDRSAGRLLAFDSSEADQIRVSTVDRFQGDEADIVIISLVVDENSRTPFVKLVNRMIVLLSRARLGMFILGNVGYFENSRQPVKHWARTFELLKEPPAASDNGDTGISPVFDAARVGPSLPLCCPQHPASHLDAKGPKDLQVGFCKVPCEAKLSCSHACGMKCHWPDKQHNKSCQVPVPSPCSKHPGDIPCEKVFANSRSAFGSLKKETVDEALKSYRCPEKVTVQLPCMHEKAMTCADEQDISEGIASWPRCEKRAHAPYVYPNCRHTLDVKCYELAQYNENPSLVKKCSETVDYVPDCGHTQQVKCYLNQQYLAKTATYVCPEKVEVPLPRCGHVKKVSCAEEIALRSWTGQRCTEQGVVHEGIGYGPRDHSCQTQVTFVRPCGHESKMRCEEAFEQAKLALPCKEKVKCTNPHCGHPCHVPCFQAKKLKQMTQNPAVQELVEGSIPPVPAELVAIPCSQEVVVRRSCGHTQKMRCDQAWKALPPCTQECSVRSLLCGHEVSIPCHLRVAFSAWNPWEATILDSLVEKQLLPRRSIPEDQSLPDEAVLKHFKACKKWVTVEKPCGHSAKYDCKQLVKIVTEGGVAGHCSEPVTEPLRCGHIAHVSCKKYQDYLAKKVDIECKEQALRPCWNSPVCGHAALPVRCSSTATLCCDGISAWHCSARLHSYQLPLCKDGTPTVCPGCDAAALDKAIDEAVDAPPPLHSTLPDCFWHLRPEDIVALDLSKGAERYQQARAMQLAKFKQRTAKASPWARQLYAPKLFRCFFIIENSKSAQQSEGFVQIRDFVKPTTFGGVQVHRLTAQNLRAIARDVPGVVSVLCAYGYSLNPLTDPGAPPLGKKKLGEARKRWQTQGHDCIEFQGHYPCPLVIFEPHTLYATHRVTLTADDLCSVAEKLAAYPDPPSLAPTKVSYEKPPGKSFVVVPASKAPAASAAPAGADAAGASLAAPLPELRGTSAEGMRFPGSWDPATLATGGALSDNLERELLRTLSFINKEAAPFAGKNVLEKASKASHSPVIDLLLSLEVCSGDQDLAAEHLKKYLGALGGKAAHPLALLALHRIDKLEEALPAFVKLYPSASKLLLPAEQAALLQDGDGHQGAAGPGRAAAVDPMEMWEELKETHGCSSEAMEKLLALTGLKKVKVTAVALFKSAQQFRRMSREAQKANALALNYCFLGNPGTGKTTVARLFAQVLRDCGLRSKDTFEECTAQKLKDEGVDEFRKKASNAMDGVLFIDEAYDLDPVGDKFKGAPIVNEMVTLTENERDRLTVILAGYEDELNTKFFAYNSGLKSRFQEVIFEDFDEAELTQIWTDMRNQRQWTESDPRLTSVSVRRILRGAGKKGFGNAREVRKRLEQATKSAMSRPDFDPDNMVLQPVDVVGEDPRNNSKLQRALAEIQSKIGWASIKEAVDDLVKICGTNYQRELDGQAPLPVFLNRMFLGNPGTGKTTCAKLYGQILKHLGFLTVGEVVFKTAGELGGSVVGESQQKTLDVLRGAVGKVLVIDEAYSLDDNLYGKQVLDTLVEKVQGSESDDIAVLLLGYEAPMLAMLRNQNPGLARRFAPEQAFRFEDYNDRELLQILLANCKARGVKPSMAFQEKALRKLEMLRRSEANFGNAGAVENLLKTALLKASSRGAGGEGADVRLEDCDVELGPEGEAAGDPLAPLDKLYRMEGVKQKIQQLSNAVSVAQQEGGEAPELGHFVFTGAPGTGKTTVARVMAKVLSDLRLIGRNHVVETSGLNLTGEYVGQTKKKVEEQLDAARGGVLFIDEAYELGRGPFGAEACTRIVEAMTDPRYAGLVIIIAGYQADISSMLDTNPGLKSRFTHFFEFPNWAPSDCWQLFCKKASAENFSVEPGVAEMLESGFKELVGLDGWGNARDVDKLWKDSLRHRADRVVPAPETEKRLLEADVRPAMEALLKARRSSGSSSKRPSQWQDLQSLMRSAEASAPAPAATKQREEMAQPEAQAEEEQPAQGSAATASGRDAGVSDEVWAELQEAKAAAEAREAELQRELEELRLEEERRAAEIERIEREWQAELERIRLEMLAEQERQEAERRARAEHEAKLERERLERERRQREEERRREEIRKAQAIKEKLRQISPCPAGFEWFKCGGGWRCGGGSHFVSDEQLQRQFTF